MFSFFAINVHITNRAWVRGFGFTTTHAGVKPFLWYCMVREGATVSEVRKLAAILVADVVGYSRLAGADEDRTLSRLPGLRSFASPRSGGEPRFRDQRQPPAAKPTPGSRHPWRRPRSARRSRPRAPIAAHGRRR